MRDGDSGLTAIELLVAIFIFGILATLTFTAVTSATRNLRTVRQNNDLNEDSRLVLNRLSRELREASRITTVENADAWYEDWITPKNCGEGTPPATTPCFNRSGVVSLTFEVDFNANGSIEPTPVAGAPDAERLTYRYEPSTKRLLLQTQTESRPLLSENVESFKLIYRSSEYKCDGNSDGVVAWQELENAPRPPCPGAAGSRVSGVSALDSELSFVDRLVVEMTVLSGQRKQEYRTNIDLRNRELGK